MPPWLRPYSPDRSCSCAVTKHHYSMFLIYVHGMLPWWCCHMPEISLSIFLLCGCVMLWYHANCTEKSSFKVNRLEFFYRRRACDIQTDDWNEVVEGSSKNTPDGKYNVLDETFLSQWIKGLLSPLIHQVKVFLSYWMLKLLKSYLTS